MNKKTINYALAALNFVAILFILQIEFNALPLIPSNFEANTAAKINGLVSTISQGVIISTIFYVIVVFLPEYSKARTIRKLITPRLLTIVSMLQNSVEYLSYKYNLPTQVNRSRKLFLQDFKGITKIDNELMRFSYRIRITSSHDWSNHSTGEVRELEQFIHEREVVRSKIDEILSLPIIEYEEDELIDCLISLRDAWFYAGVEAFQKYGLTINVVNFDKGAHDYYKHYQILCKYIKPYDFEIINTKTHADNKVQNQNT